MNHVALQSGKVLIFFVCLFKEHLELKVDFDVVKRSSQVTCAGLDLNLSHEEKPGLIEFSREIYYPLKQAQGVMGHSEYDTKSLFFQYAIDNGHSKQLLPCMDCMVRLKSILNSHLAGKAVDPRLKSRLRISCFP